MPLRHNKVRLHDVFEYTFKNYSWGSDGGKL